MFRFQAFSESVYTEETSNVANAISNFVQVSNKLRYVMLLDAFKKPDLTEMIEQMANRAKNDPQRLHLVYYGGDTSKFKETENIKKCSI